MLSSGAAVTYHILCESLTPQRCYTVHSDWSGFVGSFSTAAALAVAQLCCGFHSNSPRSQASSGQRSLWCSCGRLTTRRAASYSVQGRVREKRRVRGRVFTAARTGELEQENVKRSQLTRSQNPVCCFFYFYVEKTRVNAGSVKKEFQIELLSNVAACAVYGPRRRRNVADDGLHGKR